MRLALIVVGILMLLAALYVGSFHGLVAWRGSTTTEVRGSPANPVRQTRREIATPSPLSAALVILFDLYKPLADLEYRWSTTPLTSRDPEMIALTDALLMHAQVGDAQSAEGMQVVALHALQPGPERNPMPSDIRIRSELGNWWILFRGAAPFESALYVHDGTRIRRVYE